MENKPLHRTLQRQLKRFDISSESFTNEEKFEKFLGRISNSMYQTDETRYTLERSMQLSSDEMRALYENLQETSKKLVEAEQSKLRSVIVSIEHGIVSFDKRGSVLFSNPAAEQLLQGIPKNGYELLSKITAYSNAGDALDSRALTTRVFAGEPLRDYAAKVHLSRDSETDISISLNPLKDGNGDVEGIVLTLQDLTEHKQNMRELAQALENANSAVHAKSTFLATLSHEIRTPLNGVLGMVELLLASSLDTRQREFAEIANSSGEALLAVINEILDFSKLEAGQVELESVDFNLNGLVEDVVRTIASKAVQNKTVMSSFCDSSVPVACTADMGRIRQILLNLVSNAVKFTKNGEVKVTAEKVAETSSYWTGTTLQTIKFSVEDTGTGILPEQLEKIFQPFSQADASTTREYGGTGLGLAISQELAKLMGGNIDVSSISGAGSVFSFSVPVLVSDTSVTKDSSIVPFLEGLSVLVVDRNQTTRTIVGEYLKRFGCKVTEAESSVSAMHVLDALIGHEDMFRLVIAEVSTDDSVSVELAKNIQENSVFSDTEVLVLQAIPEGSSEEIVAAADQQTILKPVRYESLLASVKACLENAADRRDSSEDNEFQNKDAELSETEKQQKRLRFLVAEDSQTNQLVIKALLDSLGHTYELVENGEQAIAAVSSGSYDAVLMDCRMPVLDGYQATEAIRSLGSEKSQIHIIALTANATAADEQKCLAAGMDAYVAKPVKKNDLVEAFEPLVSGDYVRGVSV